MEKKVENFYPNLDYPFYDNPSHHVINLPATEGMKVLLEELRME